MKTYKALVKPITKPLRKVVRNLYFLYSKRKLRSRRKIIYALTPPPRLSNIGDHAQVIAIRKWIDKHFPDYPVIELDKNQVSYYLPALKRLIRKDDIFFLHSGGNLGDRGMWSETARRLIISTFINNKIISLPQTIYFSNTEKGIREKENSRRIYSAHPDLTIIGRDPKSGELANELFPNAKTFCMPDFVLSLNGICSEKENVPPKAILCLRHDDESILNDTQRKQLEEILPYSCKYFDTTLEKRINIYERKDLFQKTLQLFGTHDIVITDRYHGLIFAVLCRKACVVLRTVDHKLISAMDWFNELPFVKFAKDLKEVPLLAEKCLKVQDRHEPNWNEQYFDKLPELIGLK
jgi:pyruvyl transferase EpsI